jgi:hypothetical protein
MWTVKLKAIPATIGATGTISKSLRQYLTNILRKREIKELQKIAIMGIAHVLWESTDVQQKDLTWKRSNIIIHDLILDVSMVMGTGNHELQLQNSCNTI